MKVATFQNQHVFVTNAQQTIIVGSGINVHLDWSRWVMETLGDLANNATYTFSRTQLNESGNAFRATKELVPSQPPERVTVNISKESNKFYIEITCVLANQSAPDRAIFDLEACHPPLDGNEVCCKSANITVYAVERPEQLRKLYVVIGYWILNLGNDSWSTCVLYYVHYSYMLCKWYLSNSV